MPLREVEASFDPDTGVYRLFNIPSDYDPNTRIDLLVGSGGDVGISMYDKTNPRKRIDATLAGPGGGGHNALIQIVLMKAIVSIVERGEVT